MTGPRPEPTAEPSGQPAYRPPAAFAPPDLRAAPLNETEALGYTTYPGGPWANAPRPNAIPLGAPSAAPPAARPLGPARRRTVVAVLGLVAVVAAAVVALAVGGMSGTAHRIVVPSTVGVFTKSQNVSGSQLQALFSAQALGPSIPASDLAQAKVAVYADRSEPYSPGLLFLGFDAADSADIADRLRSADPADVTRTLIESTGSSAAATEIDPGRFGGSMRCAFADVDGDHGTLGVWADHDTLGMVVLISLTDPVPLPFASTITQQMRAAAER